MMHPSDQINSVDEMEAKQKECWAWSVFPPKTGPSQFFGKTFYSHNKGMDLPNAKLKRSSSDSHFKPLPSKSIWNNQIRMQSSR